MLSDFYANLVQIQHGNAARNPWKNAHAHGMFSQCYRDQKNKENSINCIEKEMRYSEYKEQYSDLANVLQSVAGPQGDRLSLIKVIDSDTSNPYIAVYLNGSSDRYGYYHLFFTIDDLYGNKNSGHPLLDTHLLFSPLFCLQII